MKAVWFSLWLAGLLGLGQALSVLYVSTAGSSHRALATDADYLTSRKRATTLVVGDSHARGLVVDRVPNALSVAMPGETYQQTRYRLPWLLDHDEQPVDTVILGLDDASFGGWKIDDFEPEYIWSRYVDFMELGNERGHRASYAARAVKARAFPWVGELDTVKDYLLATRGFAGEQGATNANRRAKRRRGLEGARTHLAGGALAEPQVESFHALMRELRSRGIRVALVSYPVTIEYREEAKRLGANREARLALLEPYAGDDGVIWLDHEHDYDSQQGVFFDGDHLSQSVRPAFTAAIFKQLRAEGWWEPSS